MVKAPGFGTQAFPVVPEGKTIALMLSKAAGEIAIALPRAAVDLQRANLGVTLFQNGVEVPISLLRGDASSVTASGMDGTPVFRLANLSPSRYSACLTPKQVESKGSLSQSPRTTVTCDSGELAAGATLELTFRGTE